ncbi:MAG: cyclic nucleotide-binding protein [Gammaproteobacteria bacterium RBG_16_57_12]|nr:MAG: cyclic nucleotide-binding protein [Gammaproteobacteria bacterium RBG_16_57_12]
MSSEKIDLANFLNQQYLCESLTIKEVKTLLDYTETVTVAPGEIIADIGEVGEALYFVIKGEAALYYQESGTETEVGRMSEGELMGEMSFFDRQPRSVRMRATGTGETLLLKLSRPLYLRLRVEHPYIAVNLLEHAIISLDHLVRRVSSDVATFSRYIYGKGKK